MRNPTNLSFLAVPAITLLAFLFAACDGEDRPDVDVVDGGSSTGSVSASSASGSASGPGPVSAAGSDYAPVSNVDIYFAMAADLRDIRSIMQPATEGNPVDWDAATAIYEDGKNQTRSDGTLRPLAGIPDDDVYAVFPDGAAVYGSADFINDLVREGLQGTGRAEGLSDNARRQIVDKGIQMLLYAKALQELEAARGRVAAGEKDDASGAPHAVDEAWATIAGPAQQGERPHGLLSTASSREGNFGLEGKLREPLEESFVAALAAAREGDAEAFNQAHDEIKGYLNAIFYLASLRYINSLLSDETPEDRSVHLAEGRTFFQTIRAHAAAGSAAAAATVEAAYVRSPDEAYRESEALAVYAALNQDAVLAALGIPDSLIVRNPPQ